MKPTYRTDGEIERLADETRERAYEAGVEKSFKLDAESVVEFLLGYKLLLGEDMPVGTFGSTDFESQTIMISNNYYNDGSHRFTVAHEIGHVVLHTEYMRQQQQLTPLFERRAGPIRNPILENQADKFASALLMPRSEMVVRFEPLLERDGYVDARDVASMFGVSVQAAEIRLKTLNLLSRRDQDSWF